MSMEQPAISLGERSHCSLHIACFVLDAQSRRCSLFEVSTDFNLVMALVMTDP